MKATRLILPILALFLIAAVPAKRQARLTVSRLRELIAPANAPAHEQFEVEISGFGKVVCAQDFTGKIRVLKELRFPTEFDPPQPSAAPPWIVTPMTPKAFETIETGWKVDVTAARIAQMVDVAVVAEFIGAEMVNGAYGELAGPIYTEKGGVITENKLTQPRVQSTTTRLHVFALPAKPCEVTLYRKDKPEKHTLTVTVH
jgi:hypothetical protein